MPGGSASTTRSNYHLLSRAFCESVAIAQVIDLDIFDIVSISNVDLGIQLSGSINVRRRSGLRCGTRRLDKQVSERTRINWQPSVCLPSELVAHQHAEYPSLPATEH